MDYDVIIIGAGVVGLAAAYNLSRRKRSVLVIEKHTSFGKETSSRNSEVIHSGIYYPENSLKALLCVAGNRMLYYWCEKKRVNYQKTGKLIVATSNTEEEALNTLLSQSEKNGAVPLDWISSRRLKELEPNLKASAALYSPSTGIVDSHGLMASPEATAIENRCDFAYRHTVIAIDKISNGFAISAESVDGSVFRVESQYVINAAGLNSDSVAELAGIDADTAGYRLHYAAGRYFRLAPAKAKLFKHLIYPVPLKNIAGLGVHLTLDLGGGAKLGPDVEFLPDRTLDYNVPEELRFKFYEAAAKYIEGIKPEDISPDQAGIRPKLSQAGEPVRDFVIAEESSKGLPGFVNLIGIESPGLTASLAIGEKVEELCT